jgi:hypothetical protein
MKSRKSRTDVDADREEMRHELTQMSDGGNARLVHTRLRRAAVASAPTNTHLPSMVGDGY